MRLRPFLGLLTAGAIVPLAIFGILLAALLINQSGRTFRDGVQQRTLVASLAIDATMEGTIQTLQALGAALEVDAVGFMAFRTVAQRILATQPNWSNISLALPSGQQVVNLQRPQGSKLHSIAGVDESLDIITATRRPVINDLGFGTATQAWDIAVRVPIIRNDEIRYILTGVVKPEAIGDVIAQQPPGWKAYVIDRKNKIIAAVADGKMQPFTGQAAPQAMLDEIVAAKDGWGTLSDAQGDVRHISVHRSALSGWALVVEVPGLAAQTMAWRSAWLIAGGLAIALIAAFALSYYVGRRRLLRPIEAMADAAAALRRGTPARIPEVRGVSELTDLAAVLRSAVDGMHERQELVRREKETLESTDQAKNEFIAMLSHELRNPLASLTAAAHLMKLAGNNPRTMTEVQPIVQRQTRHMARLVEDLLDMSRVTMGKANLEMETLDLGAVARNLSSAWRAAGRFDQHTVLSDLKPAWVRADRARMEQVLSNLLDNALKFTPRGRSIWVRTGERDGEAVIEVQDQGEGLPPSLVSHAFDLFVQGENGLDRGRGGLGIGLALVKRLVEMHAGKVEAASEGIGKGASFRVRLPAVAAPAKPRSARSQKTEGPAKPLRVLLVEDNDDTRRLVTALLAHAGHEVSEARDGQTALAMAADLEPDAVLLDIGLPDIDGYEVARRLRSQPAARQPFLVALTGYGQKEDRDRAKEAGFDVHLTKPVAPETLERALAAGR